jgi:hypothetical protein
MEIRVLFYSFLCYPYHIMLFDMARLIYYTYCSYGFNRYAM